MHRKMQESGLIEIILLLCALTIQGWYPILSHPESPWAVPVRMATEPEGLALGSPCVSILSSLRAYHQGCNVMAVTYFVHRYGRQHHFLDSLHGFACV